MTNPLTMEQERRRASAKRAVLKYRDAPDLFAFEMLGIARLWTKQIHILRAVAAMAAKLEGREPPAGYPEVGKKKKLAVRSGHKIGKSTVLAILALWWVATRKDARTILTSSSRRQIKSVLWRDIRRFYNRARFPLGGVFNKDPETGLQFRDGREIIGFATDEPEKMAGFSGPAMLFLVDESSGVADAIIEAIEGNRAGGAIIVHCSNPTKTSGKFFEAFHTKGGTYHTIHVSSEEAAAVDPPIAGLATKDWIEEQAEEYGRDSAFFAVRVLGNFPAEAQNAVISLHLVEMARKRWVNPDGLESPIVGLLRLGADVARFGDDESVVVWRRGVHLSMPKVWMGLDAPPLARAILAEAIGERRAEEIPQINVDVTGLGAPVVALLELEKDIEVNAIHAQDKPTDERFARMRDQLWWSMRDYLKGGGTLPDDPKLLSELVGPTYGVDPQGRIRVESKDEMKKRIGRSPDRADACCLAVYQADALDAEAVVKDKTKMPRARFAEIDRHGRPSERSIPGGENRFETKAFDDEDDDDD